MTDLLDETRLRRLLAAARALTSELDLDRVLDRIVEAAAEITGARYAALGVLAEDRRGLERFITRGIDEQTHRAIGELPHGRGVLGVLITDARPLRLRDISEHPRSYGFPANHPVMRSFLGVPVPVRGEAWGNLYLTEKAGGEEFDEADEEAVTRLAELAGVAIHNARLYGEATRRRAQLERVVERLEAATAIAQAIGAELDLDRVLELIVKRSRALVDARAMVALLREDGGLRVAAVAGAVDAAVKGRRVEDGADLAPLLGAGSALQVPLTFGGRDLGVLAALDRLAGKGFGREDEELLRAFASSAATAVRTAQTVESEQLRRSIEATEQERARWARELHDETLQGLGGLRVLLATGRRSGDPARLESAVDQAMEHITSEIEALRGLIAELRPAALDQLGLQPALQTLVERTVAVYGVEVEPDLDLGDDPLPPELASTVYRVVQEALTNVGKHARADRVEVCVRRARSRVELRVADDGVGLGAAPAGNGGGFGVVGMKERVALAGGRLDVTQGEDGGTVVSATIPIASREPV